jgi:hypothetical protein
MLLSVLSEEPGGLSYTVKKSLAAKAEFESTMARAEWIGICIEIALLARNYEGVCEAIKSYCEFLCPHAFSRCLRVAEALGGVGMWLGEPARAEEFYAIANAARRLIGAKMLPLHSDLRNAVGASMTAGENCDFLGAVSLEDLSGKPFWELTAPRAMRLLDSVHPCAVA